MQTPNPKEVKPKTKANRPKRNAPQGQRSNLEKIHEFNLNLTWESLPRVLPKLFFFAILGLLYIANKHYAEKVLSNTDKVKKEVKDLRADYQSANARLSARTLQSEVGKHMEGLGLKELNKPAFALPPATNQK